MPPAARLGRGKKKSVRVRVSPMHGLFVLPAPLDIYSRAVGLQTLIFARLVAVNCRCSDSVDSHRLSYRRLDRTSWNRAHVGIMERLPKGKLSCLTSSHLPPSDLQYNTGIYKGTEQNWP
ncbi:hypothetical protein XA68_14830 [Ophiocordyceps unilateralis]|uniref:Uncharacterized protein n=1 Tax=Ophiocordyceps unilateralis TaxID=268505 RepID=A0A2A9PM82_OPHUN|nr:hypothetical protein XA68_14830 [Ophiocordyceps unilateralis]